MVAIAGNIPYAIGMTSEKNENGLVGKRKEIAQVEAIRFGNRWPRDMDDRRQQFEDWRYIASQILHANNASFRLMSVYHQVMSWELGEVWSSDEEMAVEAGRCDKKTISREVAAHRRMGIILIEHGWRDKFGKLVKTRKIRMAVPINMPNYVHLR